MKLLVERKIRSVFVESSVSERNVRALIEVRRRAPRGRDRRRALLRCNGSPGHLRGTYIGAIDHNVTVITRALGGDTAKAGLNGRLAAR